MRQLQCGPELHYFVSLRIQTYTEQVPLKYGKLSRKYPWIYGYFYSVVVDRLFTFVRHAMYILIMCHGRDCTLDSVG